MQPRIIVCDDSVMLGKILERYIHSHVECASVSIAHNGKEALKMYHQSGMDLLVTDNNMPIMTGLELIKEVRKLNTIVPIILISSSTEWEHKNIVSSNTVFLSKGDVARQLGPTVQHLLKHAMEKEIR